MTDVAIIGGSFAGLTEALQLGRASRSVELVDAGAPRNRMSPAAHGVPGWDGVPPADIIARIRADLSAYPTIMEHSDRVVAASRDPAGFHLELATGKTVQAKRVLLAHGVRDLFPDIPGIQDVWGKTLLHCPYCHRFEVRNQPLAVLAMQLMSGHQVDMLHADWSTDITLLTGTGQAVDLSHTAQVATDDRPIAALRDAGGDITVEFKDGGSATFAAVFTAPSVSLDDTPAAMLGCAMADGPLGAFVQVGPMGQTSVPHVFAAGDCASPAHSVTPALGAGAMAGIGCHQSLLFPSMIQPFEVVHHD